jgi:CheY-like chemotaxis protein
MSIWNQILTATLIRCREAKALVQSENKRPVVLIVEDELLIRIDAVDMARAAGFDVVEAANADQAILILEGRLDITVVFTDIEMPGSMDGLKLASAIRGRWPPIRIVATSGLLNVGADDLPSGSCFLHKPYNAAQIAAALRGATAGP